MAGDALEGSTAPPAPPGSRGEEIGEELLRAGLDAIAAPAARSGRYAGLVAGAIVGTTAATVGYARRHPAGSRGETIFEIGSVTKLFTALALADMAEEGVVDSDDPVGAGLPPAIAAPSFRGREITLAQPATHTSGLPRAAEGPHGAGAPPPARPVRGVHGRGPARRGRRRAAAPRARRAVPGTRTSAPACWATGAPAAPAWPTRSSSPSASSGRSGWATAVAPRPRGRAGP
ncbi:MAG: serine-type D-Ala-D-Ala carboxypeptidase/endopeptidase [bacterium]